MTDSLGSGQVAQALGEHAPIAIIGLGYVGLPLALAFAERGVKTIGLDVDRAKVEQLTARTSYLNHIASERLARVGDALVASTDFSRVAECSAVLICVPTPLDIHLEPDLSYVEQTCAAIAPHVRPDTLVVLESTTWPGTTEEVVVPILEQGSSLRVAPIADEGRLLVAYSPEREDPGNPAYGTTSIPKLVGGVNDESRDRACQLYGRVLDRVVPVSSARVAEAAKLFENVFRSVNIALVNELKIIMDRMGIDVGEVIDAAATKPFGFMPFRPGPGLGGHCIPIDPFYLSWKAREYGVETKFIELAGEINRSMPHWVVQKVTDVLNDQGRSVKGSRILMLGLAYKPNVDDMRESPSLELIELLEERGATVDYHDPFLPKIPASRGYPQLQGRVSVEPAPGYNVFVLATHHDVYGDHLLTHGVPIVDTRRVLPLHPLVHRA